MAARRITGAIVRYRPRAVIGLGEAVASGISLERIAINLADERGALAISGDPGSHRSCAAAPTLTSRDCRCARSFANSIAKRFPPASR